MMWALGTGCLGSDPALLLALVPLGSWGRSPRAGPRPGIGPTRCLLFFLMELWKGNFMKPLPQSTLGVRYQVIAGVNVKSSSPLPSWTRQGRVEGVVLVDS